MLKKSNNKKKTLAEKVTETILHPNESGSDSESEDEATKAQVIDYDEDEYELPAAGTTEFRKRNVKLLSEQSTKYKGKISSRKDFEQDSIDGENESTDDDDSSEQAEDYENSDSSEDDEALQAFSNKLKTKQSKSYDNDDNDLEDDEEEEENDSESEEMEEEDDDEDDDSDDVDDSDDEETEHTEVMSKVNHEAEIQKGFCVQNQLRIWERLLELRINSQKILTKTNQLDSPQDIKDLERKDAKFKDVKQELTRNTSNLLQNLLLLKDSLSTQFSELNKELKPSLKRPSPFRDNAVEPPIKKVGLYLQERFQDFQSYRNSVLLKWDDRTKLLQPGAGARKKSTNEEYDIIKKIENALMNKSVLVQKSQQLKSSQQQNQAKDSIKGLENVNKENDLNCNIYDDSDFYHQQLRELIEYKANTSTNMSEVTKQFLELQKLRQKMKKKVDTRASKGRKLRYIVHNKLINFMAPHDNSNWTVESIEELSKSLFV